MNYLKIRSKGKIDIEALSLLGASSKRGDETKIGQFGSGNKFAIAYLLRNNYEIIPPKAAFSLAVAPVGWVEILQILPDSV